MPSRRPGERRSPSTLEGLVPPRLREASTVRDLTRSHRLRLELKYSTVCLFSSLVSSGKKGFAALPDIFFFLVPVLS
jgi:hypothetical protein